MTCDDERRIKSVIIQSRLFVFFLFLSASVKMFWSVLLLNRTKYWTFLCLTSLTWPGLFTRKWFYHRHIVIHNSSSAFIHIFPSSFYHLHFPICILSSTFYYPHFCIHHLPSAPQLRKEGETFSWWRFRLWRDSLVAKWPDTNWLPTG